MAYNVGGHRPRGWPSPSSWVVAGLAVALAIPPVARAAITNACMEDVAIANGLSGLSCTANDIRIASVTNIVVLDDGCAFAGDTVTFDATVELELSAQARYDIGIYIAVDGGDALNGTCLIDTLPRAPDPPFVNLDAAEQPTDTCGDINAAHNPIFHDIPSLTVLCVDADEDGFLDLPNCLSWRQPGSNDLCRSPLDAFPGAPSKCNCDALNTVEIVVPPGFFMLTKTASPSALSEPGGTVTFTVTIDNPSLSNITVTSLTDNLRGNLDGQGTCDVPRVIPPGGSYTCSFSALVTGIGGSSETDTVTASGVDQNGDPVSQSGNATVDVLDLPSSITIVKTAHPTTVEPGALVTYSFAVTNTSAVDTVTITALTDTIYGNLHGRGTCAVPRVLAPSASYACAFTANVLGPDGSTETNVVTAAGVDDDGNPVSDTDDETVDIDDVPSLITLRKTANPTSVPEPGGAVTFSFVIDNLSAVDAVTITSLTDTIYGNVSGRGTCVVPQVILPGRSYACAFGTTVSGNGGDSETNVATAAGADDEGVPVSDDDSATVDIVNSPAAIAVEKSALPVSLSEPGGSVTFNVVVRNESAVDTVTITSLIDSVHGDLDGQGTCSVPRAIPPGGSYACSFTVNLASNCPMSETDFVTASGTDDDGQPVSNDDSATVIITDVPSAVEIIKTATPDSHLEPGGPVTFSFVINNLSAADAVTITALVDTIYGNLNGRGSCATPRTIPAGSSYACAFTVTVSGNAGDAETNVATASGADECGNPVADDDSATVTIVDQFSAIVVVKTANPDSMPEPGGLVTFSVEIDNTSTVDAVTITALTDDVYGDLNGQGTCSVPQVIPPGGAYACAFTASVTSDCPMSETDVVTAVGMDDDGDPVMDDDPATVTITERPSSIGLVKTANPDALPEPGGLVTFSVTINNTSAADAVTITALTDTVYGNLNGQGTCAVPRAIPAGGSYSCAFSATVNDLGGTTHTNVATASGTDECGNPVGDDDRADVVIVDVPASISVTKTANPTQLDSPGGPVTFSVTVTNTSSRDTVTIKSLVDDVFGNVATPSNPALNATSCAVPQVLAPSASYACAFTADVSGVGTVTDVVTAAGTDDDGMPVSDDDDASVLIVGCGDGVHLPERGEACDDGNGTIGDGCTSTCQIEQPIEPICHHPCPSKILFRRNATDFLYIKIGFFPTNPAIDLTAVPIVVRLLNSNGVVFEGMLQAGDLDEKNPRYFLFVDPTVPATPGVRGGIKRLSMSRRADDLLRLQMKAYDTFEPVATESEMLLVVSVGNDVFTQFACWTEVLLGWRVNFRDPIEACP